MKKHLLVCLLALVLASLCMLPSQVQAAEETHDHCACGADHVNTGSHSDSPRTWKALKVDENGKVDLPTEGNSYYLTGNVVLDKTWVVQQNNSVIVLCLNGYSITMRGSDPAIEVNGTSNDSKTYLTITDCKGTGKITHAGVAKGSAVKVGEYGSFTMYGGTITGNHATGSGGGVYADGVFKMYGGAITDNSAVDSGGGVYVGSKTQAYVSVYDNVQIADNTAGGKTGSGIYFSSGSGTGYTKRKLIVNRLITDARIVIDNSDPATYITDSSKGNYTLTNGVLTAPSHQSHYLCGSSTHTDCTFEACKPAGAVDFKEWSSGDSLPTSTGNYYLTKNVTLSTGQPITGDVTLCLNGYKIKAAPGVTVNGTLTITDCVGSGSIVGADKQLTGVKIQNNAGTLNLYGGTIKDFAKGVENSGTFNMYGGTITKNSQGVSNTGTFNMHGGTITGNSGTCNGAGVSNDGSFTMSGGDITYNTASKNSNNNGYGGGVCNNGSFEMAGGTIKGNEAKQCGGGVYNNNHFEMTGGTIEQNTAKNYGGGGVYSGSNSTYIYGGRITNNAYSFGGDVYAASGKGVHLKGNVTIGGDRSNGLLTNTVHYIDGALDGSAIRLFVPGGTTNDTVLLQPGGSHKITPEDLKKFSFSNTGAGYEVILNDKGNGILSLPHRHTLCNRTTHSGAGHSESCGTSITFKEWTDAEAKKMYPGTDATAASCLPSSGSWYLKNPVTLTATHEVDDKTLNLCLNGKSVTLNAEGAVFSVKSGGELNLTDCKGTGIITHADSKNGTGVSVEAGSGDTAAGTFNLYNGNITGNSNSDNGGGVSVFRDGQFTMYGGSITNNKAATGGGVYVADHATVTIGGGSITKNEATSDGGGMTVGNCQVTLSGTVTIADNKSTGGASNLYIKGGQGVTIDSSSFASTSKVVFKDCDNQYDGTYYITNADKLNDNQLTCLTTDADKQFVKAGDENKVYVATVLDITQKPTVQNLVYNGEEQTGVNVPPNTDTFYTITGTTATQANTAYAEGDENRNGYKAVVTLKPGYALYNSVTNTYYVTATPLNLYWRIEPKKAAASDFLVDASTLTTTYKEEYHGVTVTVAKQYKQHSEDWTDKLEVQYQAKDNTWTNEVPKDAGTYNLQVHIANGANFAADYVPLSESLIIKPASRPAPASNIFKVTAPTSIGGTDGKITGVTTDMEYRTDGQDWKPCNGNTITGPDGNYQIRYAATTNYECSEAVTVNIPVHTHTLSGEVPVEAHRKSPATCTRKAVYYQYCTVCGAEDTGKTFEFGNMLPHEYDNSKWKSVDKTYHARPCKICGAYDETSKAPHEFSGKEPGCKAIGCDYRRTMYDVTLTTNYPVDCSVTTQNGDSVTNIIGGVEEGTAVTVSGNTLHIGNDTFTFRTNNGEQYSYTFTGWTINNQPIPENYTINAPVTIKANFNRVVNQYTVTWNADGGTIQDTGYTSGKQDWGTPINAPSKVVKAPDSSFSYTFTRWQDAAGNAPAATVTGNVTYTAQYTKKAHEYKADVWAHDDSGHWHVCTVSDCGYATEKTPHIYADADATVCTDCGASRTLPKLTGKVEISGELAKGERLTAVATDLPSTATQLRYQWLRDDTTITGANDMDYTLTAEDVGAKISVNVTAVGHAGSLYAIAAGQVDVIYTVSYDTNGGTIGSLRQDRVKFGADYTLPECDFITAPDKKTFDQWEIDGVSYKAGTTYRVMNDVTVVALWKDAGSDRPAPTPSRPSHRGSTIEAISTADGRSATDYSGGIYGLTFRSTAGFSSFLGVQVDGGTIAPSCYSAEEGSIVVYLKAVYLRTLKAGTHTITILSSEGNASMEFTVGGVTTSPKTFDAGVAGYVSIALLGLTGGSLCLRRKKDGNA